MATETKHTPGPWTVGRYAERSGAPTSEDRFGVFGNGNQICMAKFPSEQEPSWAAEALFNFRLIAAAPEMLEALKMAARILETKRHEGSTYKIICDAIATAERKS